MIYVGSSYTNENDIVLEDISVGPLNIGLNKFTIPVDPVDPQQIPEDSLLGNTLLIISFGYREKEFCRVGYYINNELEGVDPLIEQIKRENIDISKVVRTLSDPRVTLFPCFWDREEVIQMQEEKNDENENVLSFNADGNLENDMMENDDQLDNTIKDEIEEGFIKYTPEVKSRDLYVLRAIGRDVPGVLIELGNIANSTIQKSLLSSNDQGKYMQCVTNAIIKTLNPEAAEDDTQ